jgi:CBS domain-containing protein
MKVASIVDASPPRMKKGFTVRMAVEEMRKERKDYLLLENGRPSIITAREIMVKLGSRRLGKVHPSDLKLSGFVPDFQLEFDEDAEVCDAVNELLSKKLNHALVALSGGSRGILSWRGLLAICVDMRNKMIRGHIEENYPLLSADDRIVEARDLMMREGLSALPVVDGNKLIGLLNEEHIVRGLIYLKLHSPSESFDARLRNLLVGDVMERYPPRAGENSSISQVAQLMIDSGSKAIPIVNALMEVRGVVRHEGLMALIPGFVGGSSS